jgi:alpha-galactosidase
MSTSQVVITYIGGGSKDWAHKYFADLLSNQVLSGELRLYDIDVPAAQRNKKFFDNLKKNNTTSVKSRWSCSVIDNIDTALIGADFVLISILPYSLQNMQVDVHYPEKYGIWQSVGDTVGPGGYSRALRTIPAFEFFTDRIRANARRHGSSIIQIRWRCA